jgi:predicted amidohydrolase
MANQCGTHEADTLMGQSMVISPSGDIVEQAPSAAAGESPEPYDLVAEVDLAAAVGVADETQASLWQGRRPDLYASLTRDTRA